LQSFNPQNKENEKMKLQKQLILLAVILFLTTSAVETCAQTATGKVYEDMSRAERLTFVGEQARRIAREISGNEYAFTSDFEVDIQKAVTQYAQRIGKSNNHDLRLVLDRGQAQAARLSVAFRARNVSPLIGLYIPWVESEYINIPSPNQMGAIGMFQFLPKTGEHFGLSAQDLLDIDKSADAAARYIAQSMELYKDDPMKEALALLAYNRGEYRLTSDLKVLVNDQNRQCSICALTADRSKLDETFRNESVFYVPRFFAAAIIGENPQAFGLQTQPLSAAEKR
jgi:hypothetical protein